MKLLHNLTSAISNEPFLGFPSNVFISSIFIYTKQTQYVNLYDGFEVTGVQDDADIWYVKVLQNKQVEKDDINEETTAYQLL